MISDLKRVLEIKIPVVPVINREPCEEILSKYRILQRALQSSAWRKVADPFTIGSIDHRMEEVRLYLRDWTVNNSKGTLVAATKVTGYDKAESQAIEAILRIKELLRDMK